MSNPATYNINICQGSDFILDLEICDDDGNPVDITSNIFQGQIRKTISDSLLQATFTYVITDALNGKVRLSLTAAETGAFVLKNQKETVKESENWTYDVERISFGPITQRILEGEVLITPQVTR